MLSFHRSTDVRAGYLVDDYYSYQYPNYYDGRYRDYNVYQNDPYYFDPYRRNVSYQYVNSYIPGLYDLDYYGDWHNMDQYGYVWSPRVDAGWMPYQSGYWYTDYPYGPTWVSSEPWGYAPYHYGRWAFIGDRWYWVPDRTNVTPVYSPALVAFMPFGNDQIGWVPLAPGDVYVPHYYDASWQPYYLTRDNLYYRTVNLDVPGAVTVVSFDEFGHGFDWRRARKADQEHACVSESGAGSIAAHAAEKCGGELSVGSWQEGHSSGNREETRRDTGDYKPGANSTAVPA